jgi:aspartyl-tRNA(Asn)/glutamyl-tRNA(Gln) amidotransferase subunit A
MSEFQVRMAELFSQFDLLTLPCAPLRMLRAAEDQTSARARILRYTTPFSLAGSPVVALPGEYLGMSRGTGVQLAARPGADDMLLGWAHHLANGVTPQRA